MTPPNQRQWLPLLIVVVSFIGSRSVFYWLGVRFDISPLSYFWQYLDPALLRDDLMRSLWYLHAQPPLYNLYLGIVLKAFPGQEIVAFHLSHLAMGLTLAIVLFLLMQRLGIAPRLSAMLTVVFMLNPATIYYEHWLYTTYPELVLLCSAALFLHRFASHWRMLDGSLFFGLLAALAFLRSTYHVLWIVLICALILVFHRRQWRKIALSAALPLLLVLALYGKNAYLFGSFTSSSWMGMSMWRMVHPGVVNHPVAREMLTNGELSPVANHFAFSSVDVYREYIEQPPLTGVPALDAPFRSSDFPNYNYSGYIQISNQYQHAALTVLRRYPQVFFTSAHSAWYFFFVPADDMPWFYLNGNKDVLEPLNRLYNAAIYGQVSYPENPVIFARQQLELMGIGLVIGYLAALAMGLSVFLRLATNRSPDRVQSLTIVFMWANILFISLVSNGLEYGENNRFRFSIDGFIWVLLAVMVVQMLTRLQVRRPPFPAVLAFVRRLLPGDRSAPAAGVMRNSPAPRHGRRWLHELLPISALLCAVVLVLGQTVPSTSLRLTPAVIQALFPESFYVSGTGDLAQEAARRSRQRPPHLPTLGTGAHVLTLSLDPSAVPPAVQPLTLTVGEHLSLELVQAEARSYTLLLGPETLGPLNTSLVFDHHPGAPPGAATDWIGGLEVSTGSWYVLDPPAWMLPLQSLAIGLALGLSYAALATLRFPWALRLLSIGLLTALLLAASQADMRYIYRVHALLLAAGIAVLAGWLLLERRRPLRPAAYPGSERYNYRRT